MDDASSRSVPQSAGRFRRFLGLWRRSWRSALAAESTYETARHHEVPRDEAAGTAFKALTGDDRPALPEVASGTRQTAPAASPWTSPAGPRSIATM